MHTVYPPRVLAQSIGQRSARIRHLAARIHPLGPRPLAELLIELDRGADLMPRLEAYARIDGNFIRALGGDQFPQLRRVSGGKR